jgi:histidinol-phosphatase (PHP family)
LSTLAITEHLTLPATVDPFNNFSLATTQVRDYLQQVTEVAAEHPDVEVLLGCEIDWRHQASDSILKEVVRAENEFQTPYQLLLGSVHMLTGEPGALPDDFWPLDTIGAIDGWYQRGIRYVWEKYVELWLEAVASPVPFTIMAHPDLPKKLGFAPDFNASPLWQEMAAAAAARGLMIEVNTAGLFYDCAEVYPGPELLAEFCRQGVPCAISADAHRPEHVGRAYNQAVLAMLAAGYQVVTVPTADGDRRQIPLAPG